MPASACLRILLNLSDEQFAKLDALGPLVSKVTGAFLESRWSWPRRYAVVTPFSFMLTDPKAPEVDVVRLERLAEELQLKLFGTSTGGDVLLVLHDGDEADTAQFVSMDHATLKKTLEAPTGASPFGGRMLQLSAETDFSQGLNWNTLGSPPQTAEAAEETPEETSAGSTLYHGIYCPPRQVFAADSVASTPLNARARLSLLESAEELPGAAAEEFDIASITAGAWMLEESGFSGVIYLPVCFSSLIRKTVRANYEDFFARFLQGRKKRLGVTIYDAPRSPGFQAFAQFQATLSPYFTYIDMQVSDPGFEIDHVPAGIVTSVTLRLPDAEPRVRLAAMRRIIERRDAYKRRQIWPSITNLRTHAEVSACVRERMPFISGPAICSPMPKPLGIIPFSPDRLPLTSPPAPLSEAV